MSQFSDHNFALHPQLAADCFVVADLPLCRLLMMNDQQYPWFILVPRVIGVSELTDLNARREAQLWKESRVLSEVLQYHFSADKLNVAALGNMVPQLHIHHIARFKNDLAWPKPVWGLIPSVAFSQDHAHKRIEVIQHLLKEKSC